MLALILIHSKLESITSKIKWERKLRASMVKMLAKEHGNLRNKIHRLSNQRRI